MYTHYDPKTSIGFYSHVSTHDNASLMSGRMIRNFHPDAPIFLSFDGNADAHIYKNVADLLGAEYMVNRETMGYPEQPFGYKKDKVLEWFKRLYLGFAKMDVTHVMMWEEDSIFLGPVEFDENWECAGHNITKGNEIHPALLTMIEDFSGKKPKTKFYGNGGCSIFGREALMDHYHEIYKWLNGNLDYIQYNFYPTIGWMDCLMTIVYMLCGSDYDVNPQLYNLDPHNPVELSMSQWAAKDVINHFEAVNSNIKIIHNFKGFY